jgi:hypothetical protein
MTRSLSLLTCATDTASDCTAVSKSIVEVQQLQLGLETEPARNRLLEL